MSSPFALRSTQEVRCGKPIIGKMTLQLFSGLSETQFLRRHWQRAPLLVRGSIPGFVGPLDAKQLLHLARRDDVESRLVIRDGRRWTLRHGPIGRAATRALPPRRWTLLVSGLNLYDMASDALLRRFSFLPQARLDDVMASYAVARGGVGPHVDSYDVFLLQGFGRRRWRWGPTGEARGHARLPRPRLLRGVPLRILARFEPRHEAVLEPGDMLYLPPGWAHDGVALEPCTTWSIGFRAPSAQEFAVELLRASEERLSLDGRYADPGIRPVARSAALPPAMLDWALNTARRIRWNRSDVAEMLGRWLTEPKPQVAFGPPDRPMPPARFVLRAARDGLRLDPRSLMLHRARQVFINGESFIAARAEAGWHARLADARALPPGPLPESVARRLHDWYLHGWLHIGHTPHGRADARRRAS